MRAPLMMCAWPSMVNAESSATDAQLSSRSCAASLGSVSLAWMRSDSARRSLGEGSVWGRQAVARKDALGGARRRPKVCLERVRESGGGSVGEHGEAERRREPRPGLLSFRLERAPAVGLEYSDASSDGFTEKVGSLKVGYQKGENGIEAVCVDAVRLLVERARPLGSCGEDSSVLRLF